MSCNYEKVLSAVYLLNQWPNFVQNWHIYIIQGNLINRILGVLDLLFKVTRSNIYEKAVSALCQLNQLSDLDKTATDPSFGRL